MNNVLNIARIDREDNGYQKEDTNSRTMNILKAENIYKIYKDGKIHLAVLKDVSFEVKSGEILLIIGPSGAGKSTLLHLLGGLDEPSIGRILFKGEDLCFLSDRKKAEIRNKKIGFLFQFYHLLPEFSALENVMLPALISRVSKTIARKKAGELLELVGLKNRIRHKSYQLSGGEQQRVAIARTLINDPEIILCDEPTGNLDSQRGEQIAHLLRDLNQVQSKTLIIVSHEEKLATMANRIINICDGEIV